MGEKIMSEHKISKLSGFDYKLRKEALLDFLSDAILTFWDKKEEEKCNDCIYKKIAISPISTEKK
jgi:hypothetical protein